MHRKLMALVIFLGSLFIQYAAFGAELPDMFVAGQKNQFGATGPGIYSARFNADRMNAMAYGDRARFRLPGRADYLVRFQRLVRHSNGDVTWIGSLDGADDHQVVITQGPVGAVGQISTPDGKFLVEFADGGRLVDPGAANLKEAQLCVAEPPVPKIGPDAIPIRLPTTDNGFAASTTVDIMVLYTPGFSAGSALTKINQLVAVANQAYINSQVDIQLRVVHTQQISYSETMSNRAALDAVTDGTDPAFSSVADLRTQKGADLVVLIRPYSDTTHGSCGVAWLLGSGGKPMNPSMGYAVVSHGRSGNYYCQDITFAHEIGHNMGSAHDQAHASAPGAFAYSYGYGKDNVFGTIMSYIQPRVEKFSNPAIDCTPGMPEPCGLPTANNALSLNNTRTTVAAFRSETQAVALTGIALSPSSVMVGTRSLISPIPSDASVGTCTSSDTAVATVSGSYVTGIAPGAATITCGLVTALVSVTPIALNGIDIVPSPLPIGDTATISPVPSTAPLGVCTSNDTAIATVNGAVVTGVKAGVVTISCGAYSKSLTIQAAQALAGISLSPATVSVGQESSIVAMPAGASLGTCTSSNPSVAVVTGEKIRGVSAGSAIITCGNFTATVGVKTGFAASGSVTTDSQGNVRLALSFVPASSDVSKDADIFVAASVVQDGKTVWYRYDGHGWLPGLALTPLLRKTLAVSESGFVVLNYELSEALLKALRADFYIAYQRVGSDQLVYGVGQSFY